MHEVKHRKLEIRKWFVINYWICWCIFVAFIACSFCWAILWAEQSSCNSNRDACHALCLIHFSHISIRPIILRLIWEFNHMLLVSQILSFIFAFPSISLLMCLFFNWNHHGQYVTLFVLFKGSSCVHRTARRWSQHCRSPWSLPSLELHPAWSNLCDWSQHCWAQRHHQRVAW